MNQLQRLLEDLPAAEREEALQYYNDYFDDAGSENEQDVINSLGSPKAIADNIKAEIKGEEIPDTAKAGDHAITKYGQIVPSGKVKDHADKADDAHNDGTAGRNGGSRGNGGQNGNAAGYNGGANGNAAGHNGGANGNAADYNGGSNGGTGYHGFWNNAGDAYGGSRTYDGYGDAYGKKNKLPTWVLVLIIIGLIILIPGVFGILTGIFGTLVGLLASWFGIIIAGAAATFALLVSAIVILCVSFLTIAFSPIVFIALLGIAMLCGSFGLLGLMITVWMIAVATPALFKGAGYLIRWIFQGMGKLWNKIFG